MTPVTRAQFDLDGELAVIHRPTGQQYSTYRYLSPEDMSEVQARGLDRETDDEGNEYDTDEIIRVAREILREQIAALNR